MVNFNELELTNDIDYKVRGAFLVTANDKLYGLDIPKNSIVIYAEECVWVCRKVPNYEGKTFNARLELCVYDPLFDKWERGIFKNYITKAVWIVHYQYRTRRTKKVEQFGFNHANSMMKSAVRKHKHGNGGVRLFNEGSIVTDYECVGMGNKKLITKPEKYWNSMNVQTY